MSSKSNSKKSGESRYATRHLLHERGRRTNQSKEIVPLKACKQLLEADDWERSKFSLTSRNVSKKTNDRKVMPSKDSRAKYPKSREKVVIVSKKSSSVKVVKSRSQKCIKGVQRSVSVKKVSYSTSVILSSEEDDESDSEDDDDEDNDEEDYEDKSKVSTKKKDTVIKHTMSRIRTNYCKSKKKDNRSNKKAKALKLLREKSSAKKKSGSASRELRPRFPYSQTQEWPTARAHRMASLNALAKVHVLYENEGRTQGEPEEPFLIDLLHDDQPCLDIKPVIKDLKSNIRDKEKEKSSCKNETADKKKKNEVKPKLVKRRRKRKSACDVEIIDTRICKRMASLNAQAILAASYVQERPKRREKNKIIIDQKPIILSDSEVDIKDVLIRACDLEESTNNQMSSNEGTACLLENQNPLTVKDDLSLGLQNKESESSNSIQICDIDVDDKTGILEQAAMSKEMTVVPISNSGSSCASVPPANECGVTKYTKVTKVQINSKEMEIKEESKAETTTANSLEKDDVAITQMYQYQSNSASQSYCVRMEATFKPSSRNNSPLQRSGTIPQPHVMGAVMPTRQSYYNYQNRPGYYQPAGPMIQPIHDQYMIHKPVPYHPQPLHQTGSPTRASFSTNQRYGISDTRFSCHSDSSAVKLKNNSTNIKHSESRRPIPHNSNPGQYTSRPSKETMVDSGSEVHSYMSGMNLAQPIQKSHEDVSKQGNYKYQNVPRHDFPQIHDHHSYPLPNYQECSLVGNQQHGIPHHSKSQACLMRQRASSTMPNPYLPQHLSLGTNSTAKNDLPMIHANTFTESEKFNASKFEQQTGPMTRSGGTEKNHPFWKPPLVVDLDSDGEPKNTRTYIELDVPKACPCEKIVVVDVDKEEKEQVRKHNAAVAREKSSSRKNVQPEAAEMSSPKEESAVENSKEQKKIPAENKSKDATDLTTGEHSKKKEPSALIRRAKLHGKQRTYRDSENRPLVPYSNKRNNNMDVQTRFQNPAYQPQVSISHLSLPKGTEPSMSHGWTWEGKPAEKLVYVTNDEPPFLRLCYPSIRHHEGDIIRVRDCVLLKSGPRKTDLPFIAKITALWENPVDGEMTMSLFWYYRPEHTDPGRKPYHTEGEIFASKHCDTNSVACIEDKCFVLTLGEYCRYKCHNKLLESTCESPLPVVPPTDDYPRRERLPPSYISPEMVFYCRKVYDFRQKRILKNPM